MASAVAEDVGVVGDVLVLHVAPALGVLVANAMFISPYVLDVRGVRVHASLGAVNPWPMVGIVLNCLGWLVYACELRDAYVFSANFAGFLLGIWYVMQCHAATPSLEARTQLERGMLGAIGVWGVAGAVRTIGFGDVPEAALMFAWGTVVCLVLFYAFPLSALYTVLSQRDSSAIITPLAVASWLNGACWTVYGLLGVRNAFIWVPNAMGVALASAQLLLCAVLPKTADRLERERRAARAAEAAGAAHVERAVPIAVPPAAAAGKPGPRAR